MSTLEHAAQTLDAFGVSGGPGRKAVQGRMIARCAAGVREVFHPAGRALPREDGFRNLKSILV